MKKTSLQKKQLRKKRVRAKVKGTALRPRLSVFRSNKGCQIQLIDDATEKTLVHVSDHELKLSQKMTKREKASACGKLLAEKAVKKGITAIVFDRGGNAYHGRVKAIAESAREAGLIF